MSSRSSARTVDTQAGEQMACVLYADVRGFSNLQEHQHGLYVDIVLGGIVKALGAKELICVNTWGDAIFALFKHPTAAAECALEVRELFNNTHWKAKNLPDDLGVRIALHAATFLVTENPITKRSDAFGRNVSLAARIEPIVPAGEIWATQAFQSQLGTTSTNIACEPIGRWELVKGWGEEDLFRVSRKWETLPALPQLVQPEQLMGDRDTLQVLSAMRRIIRRAGDDANGFLCVAAVANRDFFDPRGKGKELFSDLNALLGRDGGQRCARFLFLDPESVCALCRESFESRPERENVPVSTRAAIRASLNVARSQSQHHKNLHIRLVSEIPCFLFFNQEEMLYHPYLNSAVGVDTKVNLVSKGSAMYDFGRKHFEDWWGERWVLFDLGNVLVDFHHTRVSSNLMQLLNSSTHPPDPMPTYEEIHDFFFLARAGGYSRSDAMDLGNHDIAWLCSEFCQAFACQIKVKTFQEKWNSIFDPFDPGVLDCITKLKQGNVRVAICSNTNASHWDWIRRAYPRLVNSFDEEFLSFRFKSRKPDRRFFEDICKKTKAPITHHLLIDDLPENVNAARACGMRAEVFTEFNDVEQLVEAIFWVTPI